MPAVQENGHVLGVRRPDVQPAVGEGDVTAERVVFAVVRKPSDSAVRTPGTVVPVVGEPLRPARVFFFDRFDPEDQAVPLEQNSHAFLPSSG